MQFFEKKIIILQILNEKVKKSALEHLEGLLPCV